MRGPGAWREYALWLGRDGPKTLGQSAGWMYRKLWSVAVVREAHDSPWGPSWSVRELRDGRLLVAAWDRRVERALEQMGGRLVREARTERLLKARWPRTVEVELQTPFVASRRGAPRRAPLWRVVSEASRISGIERRGWLRWKGDLRLYAEQLDRSQWQSGWVGRVAFELEAPEDGALFAIASFTNGGVNRAWGFGVLRLLGEAEEVLESLEERLEPARLRA